VRPGHVRRHLSNDASQTYIQCGPEEGQADRKLLCLVKVCGEQDRTGDEASLKGSDEGPRYVKGCSVVHPGLSPGDQTPEQHQGGQDASEAKALDQELNWELGCQKAHQLDCITLFHPLARHFKHTLGEPRTLL
jgi:hypothetical protein